jgi:hypothetical protein
MVAVNVGKNLLNATLQLRVLLLCLAKFRWISLTVKSVLVLTGLLELSLYGESKKTKYLSIRDTWKTSLIFFRVIRSTNNRHTYKNINQTTVKKSYLLRKGQAAIFN